ncbi:hypothetical protein ABT56_07095 [Photobacterium aquae]|uniref:Histidine kinase n=1 Tax=Photobacterium aquae TaxID=1195763 RepID=A0A0J1H6J4_9GAMM|nr:FIST N-terminal domain-containing protein [Photobacterium aquae]KLV07326.1 hypothetical protein ABT56_07095 [Photobacterium aquae]
MDIATSFSANKDTASAINEAIEQLRQRLPSPRLVLVYFSEHYDVNVLQKTLLSAFPNTQILGCSSCQGVMTDYGYHAGVGVGLWGLADYDGAYGSAIVSSNKSKYEMSQHALLRAITNCSRAGELPSLILIHASPGDEESVLKGIEDQLGVTVPIIGGSSADDLIQGNWHIFNHEQICHEGVGICVFYPSTKFGISFHSGYASTGLSACANKVIGQTVMELNGQPAVELYEEWMGITLKDQKNISMLSSMNPLGRIAGQIHDLPYFKLAHPLRITESGGLELFSQVTEGEQLYFMEGTEERLITRAGRVVDSAFDVYGDESDDIQPIGGITIYCAGCMLRVQHLMPQVAHHVNQAMHHAPFICPFTFGEQGQFAGGENAHGNLMISTVLFHKG